MNRTVAFHLACLLFFAVAGCNDAEEVEQPAPPPFDGVTLKIAVPAGHDWRTRWRVELDEWAARGGARYELEEYDPSAKGSRQPGATRATLTILPLIDAPREPLAAIPPEVQLTSNLRYDDLFQGLRQGLGSIDGDPLVLPLAAPVLLYYYRRDLFERLELSPPETWEQHLALIEKLDAEDLAAVEPWQPDFRATAFLARALSYAKHPHQYSLYFDVDTGEPLIDGPGFVRALEEIRPALDLMRKRNDVLTLSPVDCRRLLLAGRAAVAVAMEPPADGEARERDESAEIGIARLPGRSTVYNRSTSAWESIPGVPINNGTLTAFGGWCGAVSEVATPLERRAAWNLLGQITVETNKLIRLFPAGMRSLCRETQLAQPEAWVAPGLTSAEAGEHGRAVAVSLRDPRLETELSMVGRGQFRAALTRGIDRFLNDETTAAEALREVAEEWRKISEKIGPDKVLNSYRRSLGLAAKSASAR